MAKHQQRKTRLNQDFKHRGGSAQLGSLQQRQLIFDALSKGLDAGMTPAASIAVVTNEEAETVSSDIVHELESGRSVTEVFTRQRLGDHFDLSLLRIGESSGQLAKTARFIAERYARFIKQEQQLRAKLRIPLIIGFLAIVVLPLPDFVAGSIAPAEYFIIALLSALFAVITWKLIKRIFINYSNDTNGYPAHLFMSVPFIDSLLLAYSRANFIERLYLLFASGYPIIEALELSHNSLVGFARRRRYRDLASDLHQGFSLADTFEHHEILRPTQLPILVTGEAAGRLESTLQHVANDSRAIVAGKIALFMDWFPRAVYAAIVLIIASKIL